MRKLQLRRLGTPRLSSTKVKNEFQWADPLLLSSQLTDDERIIAQTAKSYCKEKLMPRVLQASRHETFDVKIMEEMGSLGFLGSNNSCHIPS